MITIAVEFGQPWSEARAMTAMERKSFIYAAAIQRGCTVDWNTGAISPPKKKNG